MIMMRVCRKPLLKSKHKKLLKMKKILMIGLMMGFKFGFAQTNFYCPCGQMITFYIDKSNFHKPRTNCESGFGLCLKISKITVGCQPCLGGKSVGSNLEGNNVTGYIKSSCGEVEMHLPLALADDEMFKGEKLTEFEMEEGAIEIPVPDSEKPVWIKGGTYPVYEKENELVIPLSFN
jgi:hypothetical protein